MSVIWKFGFSDVTDVIEVGVVRNPEVILVAHQHGDLPTVWVMHDGTANIGTRLHLRVIGTGHRFELNRGDGERHVGSAVCGRYVWHVFAKHEMVGQ